MADTTGIEWTDSTWNPLRGCSRVGEGCRHCYAEVQAIRIIGMDRGRGVPEGQGAYDGLLAKGGQWNGTIKLVPEHLLQPLRWTRPRRIFVNSMSDLFHEGVSDDFIDQVFAVMAMADRHTFQILTKRAARMRDYCLRLQERAGEIAQRAVSLWGGVDPDGLCDWVQDRVASWPLPNVWLGVSVEDQKSAEERVPLLLEAPAAVRWISAEPLLGPVSMLIRESTGHYFNALSSKEGVGFRGRRIDWVVVGGESGLEARPMHPEWVRSLRDQCEAARVPFLFKQWGEWLPRSACYHTFEDGSDLASVDPGATRWPCIRLTEQGNSGCHLAHSGEGDHAYMQRVGKKAAGRLLDGAVHDGYPEVRQ